MSQVIVTNDNLNAKRLASREQEHHIDKESMYQRWRMSDITKPNPVLKLIGLAFLPIVLFWGLLVVCMGFALSIMISALKVCGTFLRRLS